MSDPKQEKRKKKEAIKLFSTYREYFIFLADSNSVQQISEASIPTKLSIGRQRFDQITQPYRTVWQSMSESTRDTIWKEFQHAILGSEQNPRLAQGNMAYITDFFTKYPNLIAAFLQQKSQIQSWCEDDEGIRKAIKARAETTPLSSFELLMLASIIDERPQLPKIRRNRVFVPKAGQFKGQYLQLAYSVYRRKDFDYLVSTGISAAHGCYGNLEIAFPLTVTAKQQEPTTVAQVGERRLLKKIIKESKAEGIVDPQREQQIFKERTNDPESAFIEWTSKTRKKQAIDMKYLPGVELKALLANQKFSFVECITLCLAILKEFDDFHKNYIHCDVKPEQLLIETTGPGLYQVSLTDFGASQYHANVTKELFGTPHYTAPEVTAKFEHSIKADSFSVGIICLEIAGPETIAQYKEQLNKRYYNIQSLEGRKQCLIKRTIPIKGALEHIMCTALTKEQFQNIVSELLKFNPDERETISKVIQLLEQLLKQEVSDQLSIIASSIPASEKQDAYAFIIDNFSCLQNSEKQHAAKSFITDFTDLVKPLSSMAFTDNNAWWEFIDYAYIHFVSEDNTGLMQQLLAICPIQYLTHLAQHSDDLLWRKQQQTQLAHINNNFKFIQKFVLSDSQIPNIVLLERYLNMLSLYPLLNLEHASAFSKSIETFVTTHFKTYLPLLEYYIKLFQGETEPKTKITGKILSIKLNELFRIIKEEHMGEIENKAKTFFGKSFDTVINNAKQFTNYPKRLVSIFATFGTAWAQIQYLSEQRNNVIKKFVEQQMTDTNCPLASSNENQVDSICQSLSEKFYDFVFSYKRQDDLSATATLQTSLGKEKASSLRQSFESSNEGSNYTMHLAFE